MAKMINAFTSSSAIVLAALSICSPARAQSGGDATSDVDEAAILSDEIVVTAQRRSESIQKVPLTIQAFSGSELNARGVNQVQDLQKVATNVTIASPLGEGSAPAINIRGIGLNDFNTNNSGPNGLYVDEFAVSSPNAQGLSFFDIERIEVLKGPQGTLYGRNASGGAVNITTAAPTQEFSGFVRGGYSSFNSVNLEGAVSGGLTDTLSARVSGMYRYSEGFIFNNLFDRNENGVNMWGIRGQLLFEPTPDFTAKLKVQAVGNNTRSVLYKTYGIFDPNNINPGDRSTWCSVADTYQNRCVDFTGYGGRQGFYEGDYDNGNDKIDLNDFNATLRMQYNFGENISLVSVTGYNDNSRFHPEQVDSNPLRVVDIDYDTNSKQFTQELRLAQETDQYNWVLGGYFINERINQNQPLEIFLDGDIIFGAPGAADGVAFIQRTSNRQVLNSEAIFGQGEYNISSVFSIILGARYTQERRTFNAIGSVQFQSGGRDNFGPVQDETNVSLRDEGENFSWRIGAKAQLSPDLLLFANVSTGYKGGGFNGGFLSSDPAQRELQLRPFQPETVTAYEIGFKAQMFDRKITLNAAAFYSDYENQQVSTLVLVPDPTQPTGSRILFALDNADAARIKGVEGDLRWRVTPELTVGAQVGYLDAKFTDFVSVAGDFTGNRLSLAPELTSTVTANYERDIGAATLELSYDGTYRSKVFFEPTNDPYLFQDGYWLHNARVAVSLADSQVTIAAFVRNFTKTRYAQWTAGLFDPFGIINSTVGAPRTFGGEVSLRF